MRRVRAVALRVAVLAKAVARAYEDVTDAAYWQSSGDGVPMGKSGFAVTDPTGDVATSGLHGYMRSKIRHATSRLRRVEEPLEETERILAEAFSAYDPEHRQRLARLRELEAFAIRRNGSKRT